MQQPVAFRKCFSENTVLNVSSYTICMWKHFACKMQPLNYQLSHTRHAHLNPSRAVWAVSAATIVQPQVTLNQKMIALIGCEGNYKNSNVFSRAIWPDMTILNKHRLVNRWGSYRCGKSWGQCHLQVAFEPQQSWNKDEDLRHLRKHRPVLEKPTCNISNTASIWWWLWHFGPGNMNLWRRF